MRIRNITLLFVGAVALLLLTQCTSAQSTTAVTAATSLSATSTIAPATPTSIPPTSTAEPSTPTLAPATSTSTVPPAASPGLDGAALVAERCTVCHSIERIQNAAKTRDVWEDTVKRMIGKGANLSSDEKDIVINYLAETYKANASSASTDLNGAALVQERCTVCHSTERIQNSSKTRDEWENTVKRMIGKGAVLNSDEKDAVINYLAETYKK
jgi:cytochrome c5